jgi:hypothetical protein
MNINLTDRQITVISIALTVLFDEVAKSGKGEQMKKDIRELSSLLQAETSKELANRSAQ